jgi:3-methyladenine DNA glycosylase AlkD
VSDRATTVDGILAELESHRDEKALAGMAKFGIRVDKAYGWSIPNLRALAKRMVSQLGKKNPERHAHALELWLTGIHDAQLLACFLDSPEMVTVEQADSWVADLDSWDVCDQLCNALLGEMPFAWDKALEWSGRDEEFVKRAGFALIAVLAWHSKDAPDERFAPFLAAIERESGDDRNYVKKAVNWALRNIGKRDTALHAQAVESARRIAATGTKAGRWIAADALKELESEAIRSRLGL